jgi:CRISPR-associated endoribonuclease Cas6
METPFSHFRFARFEFVAKALDRISLPAYKGSTFRGGLGHAFKKVVCLSKDRLCEACLLKGKCPYSYVFETPPPSDTSKMRKYPFAPHPFVLTPPLEEKREYQPGELLCFELTLVGKSIDLLPYFIYTFEELGGMGIGTGRGRYELQEIRTPGDSKEITAVYSFRDKILRHFKVTNMEDLLCSFSPIHYPTSLSLHFITPTRLKFDGRLSPSLEFHILIRNLLRRISLLSYFHCEKEFDVDFRALIEQSRDVTAEEKDLLWFDWQRYSQRQETRMAMGGFMGSVTFRGDFKDFLAYLLLGEQVHVGKGTSFGLGKYQLRMDEINGERTHTRAS